ncbi:MAG TPA: TAT-variant-translocated molybdopterin oxidoreductase [Acidobacteriota bacterium]|nr:TAT-variant-translocated molybdopterin oxidoreductase [Acidobacteriota bacterium]
MTTEYSKPRRTEYWELYDKMLARTSEKGGRDYWRSLHELAETPEFQEYLSREFPHGASEMQDAVGRRRFLKLMGASIALAGATACTKQPVEKIFPYVRQPEQMVPGKPLFFATAFTMGGRARGVLAESHMGRPTKLEGNEMHPASLGATDLFTQAAVLSLYDPDRSQVVRNAGQIRTWSVFADRYRQAIEEQAAQRGAGLRILSETVTSLSQAAHLRRVLERFPQAKLHQWAPLNRDNVFEATRMVFGEPLEVRYKFDRADVIVSLDSDFLHGSEAPVRYARDLAARRDPSGDGPMSRLYALESNYSVTGAYADHRLAVPPSHIESAARALARRIGSGGGQDWGEHGEWIDAAASDLQAAGAGALVLAGDHQPPAVHALAYLMNQALGSIGRTVEFTDPVDAFPVNHLESLKELVDDMNGGDVEVLLILGANPAYDAPADLDLASALDKVPLRVHHGLYVDETARLCHWHVPGVHFLESWGDCRAYDGTVTIQQPLIAPLYGGKSVYEVLSFLTGEEGIRTYEAVREFWEDNSPSIDFESFWRQSVHDGVVADSALPARQVSGSAQGLPQPSTSIQGMEVAFLPDPTLHDGSFANNGWLQECPKQLSKLTWDNALLVSPATAERLGRVSSDAALKGEMTQWSVAGQMAQVKVGGRTIEAALWVLPGHADDCATLFLGHGRSQAGRVGNDTGFNAYPLRASDAMGFAGGLEITLQSRRYPLACVQDHHSLEGRNHYRAATLEYFREHPHFVEELEHLPPDDLPTLYPEWDYQNEYRWGMAINLGACTGCNACVVACQAENNIPVVGKDQVLRGREMHWIRVDRYFKGDIHAPAAFNQPVPCMQCENAPCEPVCPVAATVHSDEGLNDMVYNRCVGTRYCANNCPYKVRRFNFYLYADWDTKSRKMQYNPDVTVRSRGVMEKCSYCVQRISAARIEAKREDRRIRDGEVRTACQQVCPTEAILFGDLNDADSRVAAAKQQPHHFAMLAELNTRPRTSYLARITNPHPGLETPVEQAQEEGHH